MHSRAERCEQLAALVEGDRVRAQRLHLVETWIGAFATRQWTIGSVTSETIESGAS